MAQDLAGSLERAVEAANNLPLEYLSPTNQGIVVAARKLLNRPSKGSLIGVIESIPEDLLPFTKGWTSDDLIKSLKTLINIGMNFLAMAQNLTGSLERAAELANNLPLENLSPANQGIVMAARKLLNSPSKSSLIRVIESIPEDLG